MAREVIVYLDISRYYEIYEFSLDRSRDVNMFRGRGFREKHSFRGHWRENPLQKGDLKYVILDLIREKPRHGYEVIRALEERSHGFYAPSPGVVYPTLQMLEEMGHASVAEQDGKKVYSITEEGCRFLDDRGHFAEELKRHMSDWWKSKDVAEMSQIKRELRRLSRLVSGQAPHTDMKKIHRIKEVISRAYSEIEEIVKE